MSVAMKLNQVFSSVAKKAETKPQGQAQSSTSTSASSSGLKASTSKHKSGQFFDEIEAKLKQEGASFVSKVNAIIEFKISDCPNNETISYILNLKNAPGSVSLNDGSNILNRIIFYFWH